MIAYLKGTALYCSEKYLILETNGVGYQVFTTTNVLSEIKKTDVIELFIYTHVREDQLTLFGFLKHAQLDFFKLLLTVSGIGPKLAMEIVAAPEGLVKNAIFEGDSAPLTKINGLGKKTAERLILELKTKVEPVLHDGRMHHNVGESSIDRDAITALESLGYSKYQVMKMLEKMDSPKKSTEDIVKYFLQNV